MKKLLAATTLAAGTLFAGVSQATMIEVVYNGLDPNLNETVGVTYQGNSISQPTGLLSFTNTTTGDDFFAFCVEYDESILSGQTYEFTRYDYQDPARGLGSVAQNVAKLFSNAYEQSNNSGSLAAAFQLALWEIISETTGVLDLAVGDFSVFTPPGNPNTISTAQGYLDSLDQWTSDANLGLDVYRTDGGQDILIITEIAEPTTLAVFGMSLLGLAGLNRRRKQPSTKLC